jgi:replicative DNA helicase
LIDPHDISAESTVICSIIQKPEFVLHSEYLKAKYFYDKQKGSIYWAISELFKEGISKIDNINVINKINGNKAVKNLFGDFNSEAINEIIELSETMARSTVEEYKIAVNNIIAMSFKRTLHKELKGFENKCLDETFVDLNKLHVEIYDVLDNMAIEYTSDEKIQIFGNIIDEIWDNIQSKRNKDGTYGMLSKYPKLNDYFTYQDGELTLLFARRKHGKSVFCMNETIHKLQQGIPCVYFDTEMKDELFLSRTLALLTGIDETRIKTGNYSSSEDYQIKEAIKWFKSVPFSRKYDSLWTRDKVFIHSKILKNMINFQFFVYDYIKITENKIISSSEQYNELGNWCNFLKNSIAGKLDVPVLSATQMNRYGDIADSDKIERYFTTGIRWRPKNKEEIIADGEECGNYALIVEINRIGESMEDDDYLDFVFKKNILTIEQAKKQHEKAEPDMMKGV